MRTMFTRTGMQAYRLANTEFVPALSYEDSTPGRFRVGLSAEAIEEFPGLREVLRFRRVVHLVGADVGTAALTALVGAPSALLVVTTGPHGQLLSEFARLRGIEDRVGVITAVDGVDPDQIEQASSDRLSAGPDVVVDDLSTDLAAGRSSFDRWFPRLSPGGAYVFSRWSWDHFMLEGFLAASGEDDATVERLRRDAIAATRARPGGVLEAILPALVDAMLAADGDVAALAADKHWLVVQKAVAAVTPGAARRSPPAGRDEPI